MEPGELINFFKSMGAIPLIAGVYVLIRFIKKLGTKDDFKENVLEGKPPEKYKEKILKKLERYKPLPAEPTQIVKDLKCMTSLNVQVNSNTNYQGKYDFKMSKHAKNITTSKGTLARCYIKIRKASNDPFDKDIIAYSICKYYNGTLEAVIKNDISTLRSNDQKIATINYSTNIINDATGQEIGKINRERFINTTHTPFGEQYIRGKVEFKERTTVTMIEQTIFKKKDDHHFTGTQSIDRKEALILLGIVISDVAKSTSVGGGLNWRRL